MMSKAIHAAIVKGYGTAFEKLISKDIVNTTDCNGWTPLATAIEYQRGSMEKVLRSMGALETTESQLEPTEWNRDDKSARLGVRKLECFAKGHLSTEQMKSNGTKPPFSIVRADRCAPKTERGVYYFEVLVAQTGLNECVGVGFATDETDLENHALGWESGSWGFHGDDGRVYHGSGTGLGRSYAEPWSSGSTIGCGVDFNNRSIFFTVNGEFKGRAFKGDDIRGQLYPAVFLHPGNASGKIVANFGHQEFKYMIPPAPGPWEAASQDDAGSDEEDLGYESSVLSDDW
ncbi:hypothetical protein THARTR1_11126 [Trichoderma harzianum]|uniref:B30.2/SPRY domain-containing protein n=1 Tax=Trichoderma harzianum TaxID=5544 RepID=A0A2K0TCI1_TRIHA|nr:hypothetical protein THARTR1_11126 [Trichoderma harzianum]